MRPHIDRKRSADLSSDSSVKSAPLTKSEASGIYPRFLGDLAFPSLELYKPIAIDHCLALFDLLTELDT